MGHNLAWIYGCSSLLMASDQVEKEVAFTLYCNDGLVMGIWFDTNKFLFLWLTP
jgi:hypothetical protein